MISKAIGGNARIGMLVEKQHHSIHASSSVFSSCGLQHSATPPAFGRNSLSLQKHQHVNLGRRSVVAMAAQWENVMPLPMDNNVASLESLLDASSSSTTPAHPNQQSPRSEKDKEERNQNIEALIERVCISFIYFSQLFWSINFTQRRVGIITYEYNLSFIQHKSPEIVCIPEVIFLIWFDTGISFEDPKLV